MKIAICISGGLRTFPLCYKTWEKFEQLGDVDYFISTWEKPCYTKVARFDDVHAKDGDTIYPELLGKDDHITNDYLHSIINFRSSMVFGMSDMDRLIERSKKYKWHIMNPSRLLCQYYLMTNCNSRIYETNRIFKSNEYDLIVKTRPDITIDHIPENIDPEKIYVNTNIYKNEPSLKGRMMNEMIYITKPENMNKICKIYDNFDSLYHINDAFGERMSYKNFEKENLLERVELFKYGITVVRENGKWEYM